jgi:hypothetical protein
MEFITKDPRPECCKAAFPVCAPRDVPEPPLIDREQQECICPTGKPAPGRCANLWAPLLRAWSSSIPV